MERMKRPTKIKNRLLLAIASSILLLLVSYWVKNSPLPFLGAEAPVLKKMETLREHSSDYGWSDSILIVNTGYDKQLIPHYEGVFEEGNEAITNREDLYRFLKKTKESDYRFILLDTQVDDIDTEYNDSIKDLIIQMDNICIPRSENFNHDPAFDSIAGWVDYEITVKESGFAKYVLLHEGRPSMALYCYNKRSSSVIKSVCGLFYFDKWRLCQKTLIPVHDYITANTENTVENSFNTQDGVSTVCVLYKNLAADFSDDNDVEQSVKGKIVVIGNLISSEDKHDTFVGQMPGVLININAYLSLRQGLHWVNLFVAIILFFLYTCIVLFVFFDYNPFKGMKVNNWIKTFFDIPIVKLCLSFVGFNAVFVLFSIVFYFAWDYYYSTLIPSIWFTVLSHIIKFFQGRKPVLQSENKHHE